MKQFVFTFKSQGGVGHAIVFADDHDDAYKLFMREATRQRPEEEGFIEVTNCEPARITIEWVP